MGLSEDIKKGVPRETFVEFEISNGSVVSYVECNRFVSGSLNLNKMLCSGDNLKFGECNSSKFECSVSGISDVAGAKINVYQIINGNCVNLFKGKVDSAKESQYKDYVKIIAYDELYYKGSLNVAQWYNDIFTNKESITIKELRDSLFLYIEIEQSVRTLINDEILVSKTIETDNIAFSTVLKAVCEINGVFGHINSDGLFDYIDLSNTDEVEVTKYKASESAIEEYTVPRINSVKIIEEDDDIGVTAGNGEGYIICGNFLTYGMNSSEKMVLADNLLSIIKNITPYNPGFLPLIISNPLYSLGEKIKVDVNGKSVVMYNMENTVSGVQMLSQTITSKGPINWAEVATDNKSEVIKIKGKTFKLKKDIEGLQALIEDVETQAKSLIEQNAEKIELLVVGKDGLGNVILTDNALAMIAKNINLTGKVTFAALTSDTVKAINGNITIGGTNLIYNTKRMDSWFMTSKTIQSVIVDDEGIGVAHWDAPTNLGWYGLGSTDKPLVFSELKDKEVTISLDVKSDDYAYINAYAAQGLVVVIALCGPDSTTRTKYRINSMYELNMTADWKRVSFTATLNESLFNSGTGEINVDTRLYIQVYNRSMYRLDVRKIKMELGNKATDYSPNPYDVEDAIYYPGTTMINGGNIMTESVKASSIDTEDLFAQNINASGTITGGTFKGSNIELESGSVKTGYTRTMIDPENGIRTENSFEETYLDIRDGAVNMGDGLRSYAEGNRRGKYSINEILLTVVKMNTGGFISLYDQITFSVDEEGKVIWGMDNESGACLDIDGSAKFKLVQILDDEEPELAADSPYAPSASKVVQYYGEVTEFDETITMSASFTNDSSKPFRYRKVGKIVELNGVIHPSADDSFPGSSYKVSIAELPEGFRPSRNVDILQKGSGRNDWLLTIATNGIVYASCYGAGANYVDAKTTSNMYIHAVFSID